MAQFTIEVTEQHPLKEGDRYPDSDRVYEQIVEDLDVQALVRFVNDGDN